MKKTFYYGSIVLVGILASACGRPNQKFSQKAATTASSQATTQTTTVLEGQWEDCTNGDLKIWDFAKNGYSYEIQHYENADCSGDWSTDEFPDAGTFTLTSSTQSGSSYGTSVQITLTPSYQYGATATETGYVIMQGNVLNIIINGQDEISLQKAVVGDT